MRRLVLASLAVGLLWSAERTVLAQAVDTGLISESQANAVGLHRAWFTRVQIDPLRGRIGSVVQQGPTLFAQTDRGTIQAIDAESGRTLWTVTVGNPNYPTMSPSANSKYVAVVNGSTLYVLDRNTGSSVWEKRLKHIASAGIAMSDKYVHVPVENGGMDTYKLEHNTAADKEAIWHAAKGTALAAPLVRGEQIMWGTADGYLYVDDLVGTTGRLYQKTDGAILDRVAYREPMVFAGSRDGYVYAMNVSTRKAAWKVPAGNDIHHRPVAIGDAVYVIPEDGGLMKLDAKTGAEVWWVRGVTQFVAGSPTRLYVTDVSGQLLVLDAKTGTRLAALPTAALPLKVINSDTDRIFLGSKTGLLQCLHEIALTQPVKHDGPPAAVQKPAAPAQPAAAPAGETPPAEPAAGGAVDPFATPATPQ